MESVEKVTAAVGEADAASDMDEGAAVSGGDGADADPFGAVAEKVDAVAVAEASPSALPGEVVAATTNDEASRALPSDDPGVRAPLGETPDRSEGSAAPSAPSSPQSDPWAAILEAGAALLQGLATSRAAAGGAGPVMPPIQIERDPVTGQASVRLPLPDPAVLQKLAKAFEPWLR
jgi:hypothetical protein